MKKLIKIFLVILFSTMTLTSCGNSTNSSSTENSSINSSNASLETSKKVYRQGYADGKTGYGLPASERASAREFYMARGYNFSKADYSVYKMGYNDGVYGRSEKY